LTLHRGISSGFRRTEDWHGVSPIGAAALPQIVQGFVRQRIETTRGGIFLNLAVSPGTVKLGKPRPERGEFRGGKSANGILDLPNRAHVAQLTPLNRPAQPPWFLAQQAPGCRLQVARRLVRVRRFVCCKFPRRPAATM